MESKIKAVFLAVPVCMSTIGSIKRRATIMDKDVQNVAMSAILHANTPGDNNADIGIKLVEAMSAGMRRSSLIVYLCTHGNFKYEKKALSFDRKEDVVHEPQVLFDLLSDNHWTKAVAEPDPEAILDAGKAMKSLVGRIRKAVAEKKDIAWASPDPVAAALAAAVKCVVLEGRELNFNSDKDNDLDMTAEIKELINA